MRFERGARNGQSQAASMSNTLSLHAVKALKNTLEMLSSNPHTLICDAQPHFDIIALQPQADSSPLWRVGNSVIQQGMQRLPNTHSIADDNGRHARWNGKDKRVTRSRLLPVIHNVTQKLRYVHLRQPQGLCARIQPPDVQQCIQY